VDDLLLLIEGIPAGGAFIPQIEAISLNNVERIEVMRGAAPVYFGTTAFAGTINVITTPRARPTLKADSAGGMAGFEVDGFFVDFYNQPIQATSNGTPVLRSIGQQRYKGIDVEGALRPARNLTIKANVGWSDAIYRDYVTDIDGTPAQLAGNHQVLTPSAQVGGGLLYASDRGWRGSFTSNWNRFEHFTLSILGSNLTDRRDAVQLSELGEGQFYRLPVRRVDATLTWHYK
jgi:outer membrane receptor protein involved in Fe transport